MKSQYSFTFAAVALLGAIACPKPAFALYEVARGNLGFTASISAEYDSNIFANATEVDDLLVVFTPGVNWSRNVGVISTNIRGSIRSITFNDTNGQDALDPSVSFNFNMDRAEKGAVSLGLSYARTTEANDVLLDRTESDQFNGNGRVDYFYSEKTGLRFNGTFRVSDFNTPGYNDVESYSLGTGLLYRYSPKLTVDLSYSYRPETAKDVVGASNPSSDNHHFSVGFEGELRPKLNGLLNVGLARRDFDVGGSDQTLLLGSSLSWTASGKTNVTIGAFNDFDTTAAGQSARNLLLTLGVRQSLTEKISLGGNISHQRARLENFGPLASTRRDEAVILAANLSYRINDKVSAQTGITHRMNDSTLALAEYNRTVLSFGVNTAF